MLENLHVLFIVYPWSRYEKALRVTEAEEGDELRYQPLPVVRRVEAKPHPRRSAEPSSGDSLVERLKWLTTDVDDPEETTVDEVREAADGVSDPEVSQQGATAIGGDYAHLVEISTATEAPAAVALLPTAAVTMPEAAQQQQQQEEQPGSGKPAKSGSSGEKSTYRKLNELFFRNKGKEKSKDKGGQGDQWKSSTSSLNRSFSPPPPAEVEPKMKPSKKPHLFHIVGLPGLGKSDGTQGETLGRIPNVVPTVDHVYRAAVDLVTRNSAAAAGFALNDSRGSSGGNSYTLDDIDAALQAQMMGGGASGGMEACYLQAQDLRDETGGSRSSGSSGDSGLGSSHDTSLAMSSGESDPAAQDELQAFVRQDATQGRIDRIKKRYSAALEEEAEDYGFLRRPSVRGIKTRFGSTSEIIQQMQAQLAPPTLQQQQQQSPHPQQQQLIQQQQMKAAAMAGWTYANEAHQGSMQTRALLDPREKRHSAMIVMNPSAMTNVGMHLPALPEDAAAAYFQHHQHASAIRAQQQQHMLPSRPASVMNIYGSTGDLYQHLRPPVRPVMVSHHAPPSSQHTLERTSSVSSALDGSSASAGSAIYGTIRRQPAMQPYADHVSPTREAYSNPAAMMQQQPQQSQQQPSQPLHPHHQLPLRMAVSTSGIYGTIQPQQQQQQQPPPAYRPSGYLPAQDYSSYATLPARRASPYGVPAGVDPTRYRQVLPPVVNSQLVALRPTSMIVDPRYSVPSSSVMVVGAAPGTTAASSSSSSSKTDEREGPEGASSSPGLTHHDVNM